MSGRLHPGGEEGPAGAVASIHSAVDNERGRVGEGGDTHDRRVAEGVQVLGDADGSAEPGGRNAVKQSVGCLTKRAVSRAQEISDAGGSDARAQEISQA